MWKELPAIRKELAKSMITNFGLNQKEAAKKLGLTPAAVCQYFSKKRGDRIQITDRALKKEIDISAERIIQNNGKNITTEICRICRIKKSNGFLE